MRNILFFIAFLVSVSFVFADTCHSHGLASYGYFAKNDTVIRTRDTLKVVKDTAFAMSMSTNDPFNGKKHFVINLAEIPDTASCYPLLHSKVISEYGNPRGRRHSGADIKTRPNDSIRAAFDGLVVLSSPYYGYGNCIILRHTNGLETLYSHNSKNFVKKGDKVKAGQVIALTGRTGRATTEHLHFECRIKGRHFNPGLVVDHSSENLRRGLLKFTDREGNRVEAKFVEIEEKKGL